MNWRKLDEMLNDYSRKKGRRLVCSELAYPGGVTVRYELDGGFSFGKTAFSAILYKNTSGFHRYRFEIETSLLKGINLKPCEVSSNVGLWSRFRLIRKSPDIHKSQLKQFLMQVEAEKVTISETGLKVLFAFIPDSFLELEELENSYFKFIKDLVENVER